MPAQSLNDRSEIGVCTSGAAVDRKADANEALRTLRHFGRSYARARATLDGVVGERDRAIVIAARANASRANIAAAAGVTVARVQQVLAASGAVRPYRRQHAAADENA